MAITFSLVERTPLRLRYLCTAGGAVISPDSGILVNRDGPTPDLRGDSRLFHGFPFSQLVSTTVPDQATARRNMFGDGLTTKLNLELQRGRATIYGRTTDTTGPWWSCDATRGDLVDVASGLFPVVIIFGPSQAGQLAYCELSFEHTFDR